MQKNSSKRTLSSSVQKPLKKTPNIQDMLRQFENGQFGSRMENTKNMRKAILQEHQSCSLRITAKKTPNTQEIRHF